MDDNHEPIPDQLGERARLLERVLIAGATNGRGKWDNQTYIDLRAALMKDPTTKVLLPGFVRTCRDLDHFWPYIKEVDGQWAPRRKHIRDALTPLFDHVESRVRAPVDDSVSEVLMRFDEAGVQGAWQRALDRRHTDPEGAITAARTLLETVCKHILDEGGSDYEGDDLPALYGKTSALLNIAPSQHTEQAFKRILGGATNVVEGLGSLRNKIGDAHGQGKRPVRPSPRHAKLAVNMAGTMATFLLDTWLDRIPNA